MPMATTDSQTKMTTTDYSTERMNWLLEEIREIEAEMESAELTASEQEALLRDWRYLQGELREVMDKLDEEEEEEETEEEEDQGYDPNNWVDDREGCAHCSGCGYCMESSAYDHSYEI